jgi:hypothetical protein
MSDQPENPKKYQKDVDSFGNKVEKSPWLIYALLQIPIVLIMAIIIWVMYRNSQN